MTIPADLVGKKRVARAKRIRVDAAKLNADAGVTRHNANGDEEEYDTSFAMSFTKGLDHDHDTGLVKNAADFVAFRDAIEGGEIDAFSSLPIAPGLKKKRKWEAPTAGYVFDLEGPDAQAVTMDPAPKLGSPELTYEMAEVYELSVLRDVAFSQFSETCTDPTLNAAVTRLNDLQYRKDGFNGRTRLHDGSGLITPQYAFRGSSPGVEVGPYLSCFMLMGNADQGGDDNTRVGLITYGATQIDQRVLKAIPGRNYMRTFANWLDVQKGEDQPGQPGDYKTNRGAIRTPRDLATYVHFDALYQAYLNACLILLAQKSFGAGFAPFDPAFANLSGELPGGNQQAGGFALYGGPHILTLVTEVATRALKAVRWQKFNIHRRLRPEALAGRLARADAIAAEHPEMGGKFQAMRQDLGATIDAVCSIPGDEAAAVDAGLLPMAFREGSPMHPAYGAGHATVAGACVTILKAYFDTSAVLKKSGDAVAFSTEAVAGDPVSITPPPDDTHAELTVSPANQKLTLEGELNKLAANISIGRNMAGVHYFTDYYDSARMGEEIAIGILRDQALTYPLDKFQVTLPKFDGTCIAIDRSGIHDIPCPPRQ